MPLIIAPPLCIPRAQVHHLMDSMDQTLGEWESAKGI
jgi:adenosylmethionine-8-amino-7-oxononanoate aminotransferase